MKKYNLLAFNLKIYQIFIILAVINFILCFIYFGKLGTFFVDISREVYIPMAMNDGGVLYKDIFNVYAPLGYQINAFITKIFSDNVSVFYALGYVNSTFILWGLYLIARIFFKEDKYNIPFYYCILILFCAIYTISITNYIVPYSYSMVYALNSFIWSLVCLLYYKNKEDKKFLYFSFLLFGASLSFKYEFILFAAVLGYFFFKDTTLKEKIILSICFITVPLLSYIGLTAKGATIQDISEAFKYMVMLSKSQSAHNLYAFLGFIPSAGSLKSTVINALSFSVVCIVLILPVWFIQKFKNVFCRIIAIAAEIIVLINIKELMIQSNAGFFSWIGIFTLILFIFFVIKHAKNFQKDDILFFILTASTLLISFKSIFNIALNSYGSYYLPLLLLCFLIYLRNYTRVVKSSLLLVLIIFFAFLFGVSNNIRCKLTHNIGVPFDKGTIYLEDFSAEAIWKTYQYIKNETNTDETILVLPEGAMLNYLTKRKSDNKYYYLLPSNVEIFTEEKIVQDLKKNLPDYIIMTPRSFIDYKETFFCESFGVQICKLIPEYYNPPIIQKGSFDYAIAIYKKRYDKI